MQSFSCLQCAVSGVAAELRKRATKATNACRIASQSKFRMCCGLCGGISSWHGGPGAPINNIYRFKLEARHSSCVTSMCRYATMKLVQKMPGGDNIKAFTRIMHRTTDDDLVGEVRREAP